MAGARRDETLRILFQAVAQSPLAVVLTDALGAVSYVNPRFTAMTGCAPAEVPDLDAFARSFAADGAAAAAEPFRGLWARLSAGEVWNGEFPATRRDGHLYWAKVTVTPVTDAAGRTTAMIATAEDVTERREAEEAIRRAQKMQAVGVLAGGIAHDFNNLLTAILGHAHLARESLPAGAEAVDDLSRIETAAQRGRDLVRQLLAFARKERVGREVVDLRTVVEEALPLVRPSVPPGIALSFACGEGAMPVLAAPSQLHQVVLNLCRNAVDAVLDAAPGAVAEGRIAVSLERAQPATPPDRAGGTAGSVRLVVADTGCGMDRATQERIFEPFFTTKPVDRGTGLGLAAVHGIVADHGGHIDVESAPGRGARFSVTLPLAAAADRVPAGARPGQPRVLLVDGEGVSGSVHGELLRARGYRVVATANPRRALALFALAPQRFALVVLVREPGGAAWKLLALARAFAESSAAVPVLVCADRDVELDGAAGRAAGIARVVSVSTNSTVFVAAATQLVDERAALGHDPAAASR